MIGGSTEMVPSVSASVPECEPREGLEDKVSTLTDKLDKLTEIVGSLAERVLSPVITVPTGVVVTPGSVQTATPMPDAPTIEGMIPKAWREKVDAILGPDFRLEIMESSGGNYTLKFIVPPQWDRRVGDQKTMMPYDFSTGLIRRATDVADVLMWSERIRDNIKRQFNNFEPMKV